LGYSRFKKLGTSHNLSTLTLRRRPSLPGDTKDNESKELSISNFNLNRKKKLSAQIKNAIWKASTTTRTCRYLKTSKRGKMGI